jgi:hypothetical protein
VKENSFEIRSKKIESHFLCTRITPRLIEANRSSKEKLFTPRQVDLLSWLEAG